MAHNVVIKSRTASLNVDAYNRTAIFDADVDNGCVAILEEYVGGAKSKDGEEIVWKAKKPTSENAAKVKGLWMAHSPEVALTKVTEDIVYKNIVVDPRAFTNVAGEPVDMFYLNVNDIIEMTGAGITGDIKTNNYLVPQQESYVLKANVSAGTATALRKIGTGRLHIGNGNLVKESVPTYKFVVEAN